MSPPRSRIYRWRALLAAYLLGPIVGCSGGPQRPDDLPPLVSCTVTIVEQAGPVADATITLLPQTGRWVGIGRSDQAGVAIVHTQGRFAGIPAGHYAVTIIKRERLAGAPADPMTEAEDLAYTAARRRGPFWRSSLPTRYAEAETSGLTVEVKDKPVAVTFQIER